jgi:GT2 family glycosyltransferase
MAERNSNTASLSPTSTAPRVAIILLTWNGKALTLACLESLASLEYDAVEIIVVDNGSTDGTADAVRGAYGDRVRVIENSSNLGFSRGNNVGIRRALDDGADLVLLLNNDTTVDPALVRHLADVIRSSGEIGIVGPKIYYASPPDRIWFAGGEISLARGVSRHIGIRERDRGQHDEVRDVDYITGCALMARRQVFEAIGGLDPGFTAYYEDADFCMRARRAGFRVVYVPSGRVWHKISASTGGQLGAAKVSRKLKSTFLFLRRHASWHHWLTIPFGFMADAARIAVLVAAGRIRDASAGEKDTGKPGARREN